MRVCKFVKVTTDYMVCTVTLQGVLRVASHERAFYYFKVPLRVVAQQRAVRLGQSRPRYADKLGTCSYVMALRCPTSKDSRACLC